MGIAHVRKIGRMHAMGRSAKPSLEYDWMRPLAEKARDELGLTEVLRQAAGPPHLNFNK